MHIALCGPCSPSYLKDLLHVSDCGAASHFVGSGGIPVAELARGLVEAGHEVTVVTTAGSPDEESATFRGDQLEVIAVSRRVDPRPALLDGYRLERTAMASALRDSGPDIVHAHWTYEFELAAQASGLNHVTTAHDAPVSILKQARDAYRAARLLVALRSRKGIRELSAVSPYLADRWRREMAYRRPIRIIPNSIPHDAVPHARDPHERPIILEVATSGRLKNISTLLRAFKCVRRQVPEVELRLVGPGLGPEDDMAQDAAMTGLAEGVVFVGELSRKELRNEYARAWMMVHPSLEESFGLALLEALAAGLPVVAGARSGGVAFVLEGSESATLVDVTAENALSGAIIKQLRKGPQSETPLLSLERFARHTVAGQYVRWYHEMLEPTAASPPNPV